MKTLTKILSVTALVVLCVCLFTLTAFAAFTPNAAKAATCTADGNEAYTESGDDGKFYRGLYQTQAALDAAIAAGETTGYDNISVFTIPATGHPSLTHVAAKEATCYAKGNSQYWFCSKCGKYYSDASGSSTSEVTDPSTLFTDPKDHTTIAWTHVPEVKPNCVREGNVEYYKCPDCGALSQTDSGGGPFYADVSATILPKTDHNWGAWTVTKPQTNVSPGQEMHECQDCGKIEYREIPADGITNAPYNDLWYVVPDHDTWLRGEEALTFDSNLVEKLNAESGLDANFVGVRIGTDSLYENSYDTFDFWSWDRYIKLGDKTMQGLREGKYRIWVYDKRNPKEYTTSCDFWVVDVPTLEPYSTDKHVVNSSKSLRFIASEEIDPNTVQVGSKKLYDANDFFVSNDRQSITLSPDFLNARQTGTYTISAQTKDGHRTIKTNFYILSTAQASSSPRTGDESQIGLWAAFLLLSGAAVVVLVPKLRKQGVK